MYFKTDQGLEIQEILEVYCMRRAGKSEEEIKLKTESYPELFKINWAKFSTRAYSTFDYKISNEN